MAPRPPPGHVLPPADSATPSILPKSCAYPGVECLTNAVLATDHISSVSVSPRLEAQTTDIYSQGPGGPRSKIKVLADVVPGDTWLPG